MSFKLKWTFKQFRKSKDYQLHKDAMHFPIKYYLSLLIKLIPGLYNKTITLKLRNGFKIKIKDFMSLFIYHEIFIDKAYDLEMPKNDPTIIDVGGNIGLFVLRYKQLYPKSKVYSFEPVPNNYADMLDIITSNKLTDVVSVNAAIMDKKGKINLFLSPTNHAGHSVFKEISGDSFVEAESTTLEMVFANYSISECDLLKLDCEGAEYEILKSINPDLARKIKTVIYEPTYKLYSVNELNSYLETLGYQIRKRRQLFIATHVS
jgi:FkbM family methyltransferase